MLYLMHNVGRLVFRGVGQHCSAAIFVCQYKLQFRPDVYCWAELGAPQITRIVEIHL